MFGVRDFASLRRKYQQTGTSQGRIEGKRREVNSSPEPGGDAQAGREVLSWDEELEEVKKRKRGGGPRLDSEIRRALA